MFDARQLISGALASHPARVIELLVPPSLLGVGTHRRGSAEVSTLLGPEETDRLRGHRPVRWPCCSGLSASGLTAGLISRYTTSVAGGSVADRIGCCLLFVNCIVDASILWPSFLGHTVDALASGADEGRGRLR